VGSVLSKSSTCSDGSVKIAVGKKECISQSLEQVEQLN